MTDKNLIFNRIAEKLHQQGLSIINKDDNRPWGGFYVIDENQALQFAKIYFPLENIGDLKITQKLSPKILLVAPHARLSWQYHYRRAEIWKCIEGPVSVITSETDVEKNQHTIKDGEIIRIKQGERHRLIGLNNWGIIAEIWQHTDVENPSDEDDIVRIQDDFGR